MITLYYISGILALCVTIALAILIGMSIGSYNNEWLSDCWALILIEIVAILITVSSFTRVGQLRVKTVEHPIIETRIKIKMTEDSIERDTLYIYRFDNSKIR